MRSKVELARHLLTSAFGNMNRNVEGLRLEEALYHSDGYRSILGLSIVSRQEYLDEKRPLHWGDTAPLFDVVVMVANHVTYHTGELNMLSEDSNSRAT